MTKWIQLERRTVNCVIEPYYVASFSQAVFLISKHPHSLKTETGWGRGRERRDFVNETPTATSRAKTLKTGGGYPIRRCKPRVSAEFNSLTKWMAYWIRHTQECMFHARKKQQAHVKSTMGKRSRSTKNKYSRSPERARDQTFRLTKCLKHQMHKQLSAFDGFS